MRVRTSRVVSGKAVLAIVIGLVVPPRTSLGQMCIGDCDGLGVVGVAQVVVMVNIALRTGDPSGCPNGDANTDGVITVDEILIAVRNALAGCPKPDVSGAWLEDQFHLTSSTCAPPLTQAEATAFGNLPPCLTLISVPAPGDVSGVDCNGIEVTGQAEPTGVVHFSLPPESQIMSGCTNLPHE